MSSMSAWDHAKISKKSYSSDKELTSSCKREFPKLTCFRLFGPNSGCSRKGFAILGSSRSIRWAPSHHCYLIGVSSFYCLTS